MPVAEGLGRAEAGDRTSTAHAGGHRAGFRETLMQAPVWDALAHSSRSVDVTRQLILDRGIKGAIAHFRGDDG